MCRVFVSGRGNVFMREIAEHVVEALRLGGRQGELVIDEMPSAAGDPLQNLVVAPHEFFVLSDASEADRLKAAERAVCINTEQPGTHWFDLAMTYAARGPVVLDINRFSLDAARRHGLTAVHLPLGCTPSMDAWGGAQRTRAIDIAFHGGRTPRREAFLGGAGGVLWEWQTDMRLFSWHRPVLDGQGSFVAGAAKYAALANTRILLNLHRGDEPYFEWARVVEAIANGCVVASETSVGFEPLVSGVHFVMAPFEHLAEQAVALAFDEPRRAAMAEAAYKLTTSELSQEELLQAALNEAAKGARVGGRRRAYKPARRPREQEQVQPVDAARDELGKAIKAANEAYLAQIETSRALEAMISLVERGDAGHAEITTTAAWASATPEVSVVVTASATRPADDTVQSVIAATSSGVSAELIVLDNHAGGIDWFPAMFVVRSARGGVDAARHAGVVQTRAPFVLLLRGGDTIYPTALQRLLDCLRAAADDVVAAYGVLEQFDAAGSSGLINHLDWNVEMLVNESYLDATALYRRDALVQVGRDRRGSMIGWEDYDQWLAIAERGWRAESVRSVVGRCHQIDPAERRIVEADVASTFVIARQRHPRLPWPS
jgi:hypothetical protein